MCAAVYAITRLMYTCNPFTPNPPTASMRWPPINSSQLCSTAAGSCLVAAVAALLPALLLLVAAVEVGAEVEVEVECMRARATDSFTKA